MKLYSRQTFFPKGSKASTFSTALWGQTYEVLVRTGINLYKIHRVLWNNKILMVFTPQQDLQKGCQTFHVVTWTEKEDSHG